MSLLAHWGDLENEVMVLISMNSWSVIWNYMCIL